MTVHYSDDTVTLHHGDCLDVLREMPDASVDAACTDPPYGLEFMGREWDSFKSASSRGPGGTFALGTVGGFTGKPMPRHGKRWRLKRCAVCGHVQGGASPCTCEQPDWEVEHEPGTPNFAATYQRWCEAWAREVFRVLKPGGHLLAFGGTRTAHRLTCAIEDAGFEIRDGIDWLYGSGFPKSLNLGDGRGTALKPAREPIVVARKPLAGTVSATVLGYGTGALNIDACRTGDEQRTNHAGGTSSLQRVSRVVQGYRSTVTTSQGEPSTVTGRWPTNVVLSHAPMLDEDGEPVGDACTDGCVPGCPVAELDRQSGVLTSGANPTRRCSPKFGDAYGEFVGGAEMPARGADSGGASRFFPVFRYEAKAPTAERPRTADGTAHPTVKPLDLMRWLVRLVTPPGGTVLEPFAGSGTTAEACVIEGLQCIAIEREAAYLPLITARLSKPLQPAFAFDFGGAA